MLVEWVVVQGLALFVKPLADQALSTFTNDLGERVGKAASTKVMEWVRQLAGGAPGRQQQVVEEAVANPEVLDQVRADLQQRLQIELPPRGEGHPPGSDAYVLDAYHAVFWRVAVMAWWARRTVVVEGAPQGREWLLACYPTGRLEDRSSGDDAWAVPRLDGVWDRATGSLTNPLFPQAEFWVKRVLDDADRARVLQDANSDFREEPRRPVENHQLQREDRWHRVDGIHATWVQLRPDSESLVLMRKSNPLLVDDIDFLGPRRRDYPSDWQDLIDIKDPAAAIAVILAGVDKLAEEDAAFRASVERALKRG